MTETSRRSRSRWIAIGVVLTVSLLAIVLATRPSAESKNAANPLVGLPAPSIKGTALDGGKVNLEDYRGRYVVVNFFATWCVPCREEHPELVQFSKIFTGPNSPAIISIAYDKNDIDAAKSFFAQYGGDWPVVPDNNGRAAVDYGVRGLPESYIVDPEGKISKHITGGVTLDELIASTGGLK